MLSCIKHINITVIINFVIGREKPTFFVLCRFACNARRKDEHNITVHEVDGSLFLRACKDINPRTELLLWSFLADPLEHDGSQGGSLTTPGKPRKQVTPRKSREDGSPDVNSTEQELKLIGSLTPTFSSILNTH